MIWPEVGARGALALSIAQRTLSFVVPLYIGFYLLSSRRRIFDEYNPKTPEVNATETIYRTLAVVGSYVFASSAIVNVVFTALFIARRYTGELTGVLFSLSDEQVWIEISVYSLCPLFVLLIAIILINYVSFISLIYVLLSEMAGFSFMLAELICENSAISPGAGGYYWHQFVLGTFLCSVYFLVARVLQDRMLDLRELLDLRG